MSTTFAFGEQLSIEQRRIVSAALGASNSATFNRNDIGKAVKLGSAQNYVLAADGDEIEGFVSSVEVMTVNGGFSFGAVQRGGDMYAKVGSGSVAVGGYVVSYTQAALGTAGAPAVKAGSPTKFLWRCVRIVSGTGTVGDTILLRREN